MTSCTKVTLFLALSLTPGLAGAQEVVPEPEDVVLIAAATQDEAYQRATESIDRGRYGEAIELLRGLIDRGSDRQDAAMYWIAYAQNRSGRRGEALQTVARLRTTYPASPWIDDADYLEAEIRGAAGGQADPTEAENEEMRLHALNALMRVDAERALPILRRILESDESDEMRERALFVLLQGEIPGAFEIVADVARTEGDGEVRRMALQGLGMLGGESALDVLDEVYAQTGDLEIKESILHAYMMASDGDRLMRIARSEGDTELRVAAIQALAMSGEGDELWELYESESSVEARAAILHALGMTASTEQLVDLIRSETNPELRRAAAQGLAMGGQGGEDTAAIRTLMIELYRDSSDRELRMVALQTLWMQEDAAALIELFEGEQDPEMKRQIVEALSVMESDEAVEFLIRLIER